MAQYFIFLFHIIF